MKAIIIPRGGSLIEEIRQSLVGDGKDYSSSLVVFPGKRPAHFLRKALAREVGSSLVPPKIFSMDEFVDMLFASVDSRKKIETMDAVAILYHMHRKAARRLGGEGFMTPDSFFPLGVRIYHDIEELTIEGINQGRVRELGGFMEGIPEQSRERLQSLSFFYEGFYRETSAAGFSTRSERYVTAASRLEAAGLEQYRRIVLAGFYALTKTERDLFQKLLSFDNACFFFQEGAGLSAKLKEMGIGYTEEKSEAADPEVSFYSSPDSHGQVLALGSILGKQAEADGIDEKTVVVLPASDTLFPLMRHGLSALPHDSYNVSLGYPLLRTPVFGFLNNLMELRASMDGDRVYVPDYLKFVLHPYTKNIYFKGSPETTRILFHTLEEELLKQRMKTFVTLEELEGNAGLYESVLMKLPADAPGISGDRLRDHLQTVHRNTIGNFLSFRDVGDFAGRCIEVLVYVSNNSTARLHPLFRPFLERFVDALEDLGGSLMKEISFADTTSYFMFFRKSVQICHMPFPGTPVQGLQVLGLLETRNLLFDRVYVLDANEDILPDTRREETLLPFAVRQMLGLPTYLDRDALVAYYFDCLMGSAREAHLFFVEDDKKEKSRFVEKLLWARQKKAGSIDAKSFVRPLQYQVKLANRGPEAVGKTSDMAAFLREFPFSATALNEYLECPIRFCYSWVLRMNRKDEISGDIERIDVGVFVHEVLKRFFRERTGRRLRPEDVDPGSMDSLVERTFEKKYGSDISGAVFLLKKQIRAQLSELLTKYYAPLVSEQSISIVETEKPFAVSVDGFRLKGRPDSIEQRDGKTVIVDFKTSGNPNPLKIDMARLDPDRRETWNNAIGSIQLPFYVLLYAEGEKRLVEGLDALFLLLGKSKIDRKIELRLFGDASPQDMYLPLKKVIFGLMTEIADPRMPFAPPPDCRKACPGCDYQYLCGTQWIVK